MAVGAITDWASRLAGRLYEQHKTLPKFEAVAAMLAVQAQQLEDALQSLFTISSIDDSEGLQLDVIGRIVNWRRLGVSDDLYRHYLRARIRTIRSHGTVADLYSVFFAMLGADASLEIQPGYPAGLTLFLHAPPITEDIARDVAAPFLKTALAAGVYGVLVWTAAPVAGTFYTARAAFLTGSPSSGATSLAVDSTADFPATGSLRIDAGTADAETVTYAVADATHFTTSATANAHGVRAALLLVGSGATGLGFPLAAFLTSGASAGATSLVVDATAGFASSGSLVIDAGTADEETVTYTVVDGTHLGVSALANAHGVRAACYNPTTGGKLAGAFSTL